MLVFVLVSDEHVGDAHFGSSWGETVENLDLISHGTRKEHTVQLWLILAFDTVNHEVLS